MTVRVRSKVTTECATGAAPRVALAPFLEGCPGVITLGIQPALDRYSPEEKRLLQNASRVFFPSWRYLGLFEAVAKPTFPSAASYRYQRSLVLQQTLFSYLKWPAPRTRIYYGNRQKRNITSDFAMPVQVSSVIHRGRSPALARCRSDLQALVTRTNPVVIREVLPWQRSIRCIAVNYRIAVVQECTEAGTWIPVEATDRFHEPIAKTLELIEAVSLDDIMVNWGLHSGTWICDRLNRPPWRFHGLSGPIDRHRLIGDMIQEGVL